MKPPHAVARLRTARIARSVKPFRARGGSQQPHCAGCRLILSHCMCHLEPRVPTRAGVCLLMADIEALKPSNTGWLIADVVPDTFAFGWARTEVDPALLALLADPQWLPVLVFPGEFAPAERVMTHAPQPVADGDDADGSSGGVASGKRLLFVLLDATWAEARKMFRKSPYLDKLPILSLEPEQVSRYRLRRSRRDDHFCTAEVAAMCLEQGGDALAASMLGAYLDVYSHHYLQAKNQRPALTDTPAHVAVHAAAALAAALRENQSPSAL
ncbi:DTW domain-containing protein [Curvibacter sp. CHRR-16]|uniref:tRNA-uridine aminocarboxypropyltransferase n=1 Tax=Curvibacter sp. CHRR-16 TaxID=2835872 RepID=UPI001BDB48DD|nr:tRNA-uridine aminocarboxypropyltransferase [Curvibacter sp. CHRR-16]MBT0570382.1 DTW domain-containing protein [Curvibacter sp. CHRR-16]